jgi:signal transduction histidine kinase
MQSDMDMINPFNSNALMRDFGGRPMERPIELSINRPIERSIERPIERRAFKVDNLEHEKFKQKVNLIQRDVDQTKEIMIENIHKALAREEKLAELEAKTQFLMEASHEFRSRGTALRRRSWWQRYRIPVMVGSSVTSVGTLAFFLL